MWVDNDDSKLCLSLQIFIFAGIIEEHSQFDMTTDTNEEIAQYLHRISDIEVSCRMLAPLCGYEKMPLVSLEEAVQPLVCILPEINHYIYVTKQRCADKPDDDLTQDESASIMLYSMKWEPDNECLYFLLTALARIPSQRRTVFRRVKSDIRAWYPTGETVVWWGFPHVLPPSMYCSQNYS
jgi:hypothetical protein